jgi:hypothetical protein
MQLPDYLPVAVIRLIVSYQITQMILLYHVINQQSSSMSYPQTKLACHGKNTLTMFSRFLGQW